MIKKVLFALCAVLFASSMMAQQGSSCNNPIPVDSNYVGYVDGPCTLWYTASTYDLPLNVHFIPDAMDSDWWPEVEVDLTCVQGVYSDPKVDSIIKMASGFDITFPVELSCDRVVNPSTGKTEWDLLVDAMYREQLAQFGVTYNVAAYVKVTFLEAGKISLKPDTTFASCMQTTEHVVLDDSIAILPNDADRVFMMPYTDWQNDSIQFVWTGAEPAYVYMASGKCDFEPTATNGYVWGTYVVKPGEPFKLSNKKINDAILDNDGGGLFYSKVISASEGKLVVEKIPLPTAQEGAVLLEYDVPVQIKSAEVYCFPVQWTSTQFVAGTNLQVKAYFSATAAFTASDDDSNVLASYSFSTMDDMRELSLSSREMKLLTDESTDGYIYVRFKSTSATTITPYAWDASYCADKSTTIVSGQRFRVEAKSSNTIFRMRYDDWKGYEMSIDWEGSVRIPTYIADTCYFTLSSSNKRVVKYNNIKAQSVQVYDASVVDSWASRVDGDGFLYVRMNPTYAGYITFNSAKPIEEDPVEPTSPCVLGSIELKAGDQLTLNLDSAFTIYRIDYAAWKEKGVTLSWAGVADLHTFVAETCTFAVAPYNKYVHVYVPVQGEYTIDAAAMVDLAEYVDEDGYLYIRFLTKEEGVLTVE